MILGTDVKYRYNELLKEADYERLVRRVAMQNPGFQTRTVQNLGNVLISLGKSLKSLSLSL